MRRDRLGLLLLVLVGVLGWAAYRGWYRLVGPATVDVPSLAKGHEEVACFLPATSADTWERLVAAIKNLEKDWVSAHPELPPLRVSFKEAFQEQTASVPQIALFFAGHEQAKLWIRWYKLSGEIQQAQWLDKLHKRGRPPLAVMGGDSSDRAVDTARDLEKMRREQKWPGPLFLVISATADRFYPGELESSDLTQSNWPKLVDVYSGMTFRFCFTNEHMAYSVLDFVRDNPRQVWPDVSIDPTALTAAVGQGNNLGCLTRLAAAGSFRPVHLYTVAWNDDRYSQDLADRFAQVFFEFFYQGDGKLAANHYLNNSVRYSVGGFFQLNPWEQLAVTRYLAERRSYNLGDQLQLLAVPAGSQQTRRFLHALCQQAPTELQNVVVVSGDSINFNNVYRDSDLIWNVQDVPMPLIFFSHRDPVNAAAGFRPRIDAGLPVPNANQKDSAGEFHTTGTHELLLLRDVIEALVQAAWTPSGWSGDVATVRQHLRELRWHEGRIHGPAGPGQSLFDLEGNRRPHTGEHVVWLQPVFDNGRNLPRALLSVWTIDRHIDDSRTWKRVHDPIIVNYDQTRAEVGPGHAGD